MTDDARPAPSDQRGEHRLRRIPVPAEALTAIRDIAASGALVRAIQREAARALGALQNAACAIETERE